MKKKVYSIILGITLITAASILAVVFAANNAEQSATTNAATTIGIKDQTSVTDITAITFPAGDCGATVDNPSNSESQEQTFGTTGVAKPVVTLSSPADYSVWFQVENFSNSVVASEYFALLESGAACTTGDSIETAMTLDNTPLRL